MDDASRLSMTNIRALSRYRTHREQQACRIMQADTAARDSARKASVAAATALASAERDRSLGEQRYYRDLASNMNVTVELLYRKNDELARLTDAVQSAKRLADTASATLAHSEQALLRSAGEYRARLRDVRKLGLLEERLEQAFQSRMELVEELDTEEQGSIRHANGPDVRSRP